MNDTQLDTIARAIKLNEQGYNLTFYLPWAKGSCFQWGQWKQKRQSVQDLINIVNQYPNYSNLGVICGDISRLLVLDFDSQNDYFTFARLYNDLANSFTVQTARGFHVWYRMPVVLDMEHPMCEVWSNPDHYASTVGCIHPTGHRYGVFRNVAVKDVTYGELFKCGFTLRAKRESVNNPPASFLTRQVHGGYTSNSIIGRIKQQTSMVDLLGDCDFTPSGNNYMIGHCPFHDDQHKSLSYHIPSGRVKCLASHCIASHRYEDTIGVYAIMHNITNREAIAQLAGMLGDN